MSRVAAGRHNRIPKGARIIGFAVGADFWLGTTLVRVVRVAGPNKLLVRHLATQRLEHVGSGALRAIDPDFDTEPPDASSIAVQRYSAADWERARAVETLVKALESQRTPSCAAETRAARKLDVSLRHLRR